MSSGRALPVVRALFLFAIFGLPSTALAQEDLPRALRDDRIRVGLTLGGTGLVGLIAEYQRGDWSAELTVGTISFRDVAVAIAGKHYFGSGKLRPAVGLGFWSLSAWTDDGSGSVFLLRAPIALDWEMSDHHAAGLEVGLNRALAVDRLDPQDDTPARSTIVPLPGAYYRYGWSP
jgi:hypothetical protein